MNPSGKRHLNKLHSAGRSVSHSGPRPWDPSVWAGEHPLAVNEAKEPVLATFRERFLATVIDSLLLGCVSKVYGLVGGVIWPHLFEPLPSSTLFLSGTWAAVVIGIPSLAGLIWVLYQWHYYQSTPGKRLFSLYIVDEKTGEHPTFVQFLARYLSYFVSLMPVLLGYAWAFYDPKVQAWHDKLAGTLVISRSRRPNSQPGTLATVVFSLCYSVVALGGVIICFSGWKVVQDEQARSSAALKSADRHSASTRGLLPKEIYLAEELDPTSPLTWWPLASDSRWEYDLEQTIETSSPQNSRNEREKFYADALIAVRPQVTQHPSGTQYSVITKIDRDERSAVLPSHSSEGQALFLVNGALQETARWDVGSSRLLGGRIDFKPPLTLFPARIQEGERWLMGDIRLLGTSSQSQSAVVDFEDHKVLGRLYRKCLKVESRGTAVGQITLKDGTAGVREGTISRTEWYARGIGMVQREDRGSLTVTLAKGDVVDLNITDVWKLRSWNGPPVAMPPDSGGLQ